MHLVYSTNIQIGVGHQSLLWYMAVPIPLMCPEVLLQDERNHVSSCHPHLKSVTYQLNHL